MIDYRLPLLGAVAILLGSCRESSSDAQNSPLFSEPLIAKTLERVRQEYVQKPDEKKMLEGALNGMLMALDPYSCFFNAESYKLYTESTKGEFGGLGLEILPLGDGRLKVIAPMDDMPAQKAGLKAGDIITHMDGAPLFGQAFEDILKRLHGKPGTAITLKIDRGSGASFTVKVTRELITVNPVKHRAEGKIGYIRISYFNDQTVAKVKEAIDALQKTLSQDLRGLVLDLRNNPGGTLEQAVAVSNCFLEAGTIVHVKGRMQNETFTAKGKDLAKGIPIAVLVNQGSASASEIVAGALRDNHRAVLMGEKTFGKGSVQMHYPLEGYGGIKLTIAWFYTPKGDEIQGRGIQPDILLSPSIAEPPKDLAKELAKETEDKQLQRSLDLLQGLWAVRMRS